MAPILLVSIVEGLVRLDTHEQNECHVPFPGNYSIASKLIRACECNVSLGLYCKYMQIASKY